MIPKILGVLDILSGIFLWICIGFHLPFIILNFLFGGYLIAKGAVFSFFGLNFFNILDIIIGIVIIVSYFQAIPKTFIPIYFLIFYLIIKGWISIISS